MLRISLLGDTGFYLGDRRLDNFASPKARLILAYLMLHSSHTQDRMHLSAQFWADLPDVRARKILNTELWRLCTALKEHGIDPEELFHRAHGVVGIKQSACFWCDAVEFKHALRRLDTLDPQDCDQCDIEVIESAVDLYQGELLTGTVDDWCLLLRQAYIEQYSRALEFLLIHYMQREKWHIGVRYCRRLLEADSSMEHIHRDLMRCQFRLGNRPAAIRQYVHCKSLLQQEFGVDPMDSTTELFEEIAGSVNSRKPVSTSSDVASASTA